MRLNRSDRFVNAILYVLVTLFSFSVLYPFYYVAINSVNKLLDFGTVYLYPKQWDFQYYHLVLMDNKISGAFMMSVLRTLAGIFIIVTSTSMAAFALRKPNLKFRKLYLSLAVIPLFFGGGLIPYYLVIKTLMLYNTFWIYVLPGAFNFFYIVILMSVFNDVGQELEDSAKIDGAGYFSTYARIFVPLSVPVIATISLFEAVSQWNSWFDTVYFTSGDKLMTLSAILLKIINDSELSNILDKQSTLEQSLRHFSVEGIKYATMILATLPILVIYPFVQRYFVKGIKIGALKG